jgi:hypothetical protein
MEVRYRLDGQFGYSFLGTFFPVAPTTGFLRLAYPTSATGPLSSMGAGFAPQPGPVALLSGRFDVRGTELIGHLPSSMAVAARRITVHFTLANALGTLRPTGTLLLPQLSGDGSGMITCGGSAPHCDPATAFIPQPLVFDAAHFSWNAVNHLQATSLHAAALVPKSILVRAPANFPNLVAFQLVTASEIDRHLVPEPGSLPLAAGGLAGIALLAARRRRGRRLHMRATAILLGCAAALSLLPGARASASTLQVRYEVSTGFRGFGAPTIPNVPPYGQGILTLWYQTPSSLPVGATGPDLAPLPGPVTLLPGRIDLQRYTLGSHAPGSMFSGLRSLTLMLEFEHAHGSLNTAGTLLLPEIRGVIRGKAFCTGGICGSGGGTTRFTIAPLLNSWTAPGHLVGGALRASALESLLFTGPNTQYPLPPIPIRMGVHIRDAREIDRMVVPEPGTLPLAAGGLAALALFASRCRHRRA